MKIIRVEEKKPTYIEKNNTYSYEYDILCDGKLVRKINTADNTLIHSDIDLLENLKQHIDFLLYVEQYTEEN